ncbi:cysteine hydrolase family protein [Solobacterium moorei]|uniref:cysteine hydrolase family protein n=1 Tax=Solobacterium moorei TaxID=102148 RepID=UPI0023F087B5|nr:cysteine hydrolase family protein [Solobacterium moorei]MDI6415354.1 cysteine hydrolase family protein [Solobacterium moorei]
MKVLIAIDIQNDFVSGSLGTKEAEIALSRMVEEINSPKYDIVFATQDTHDTNYLNTLEGKYLPVVHCIKDTEGWRFPKSIEEALHKRNAKIFEKDTFGSLKLAVELQKLAPEEIVLIGICTDICVVTNALLLRTHLPNTKITVVSQACAATTIDKQKEALDVMTSCQIEIEK